MKQGCPCCDAQLGDLNQSSNKYILKRPNYQTMFDSMKSQVSCEGSEGSALGECCMQRQLSLKGIASIKRSGKNVHLHICVSVARIRMVCFGTPL